MSRPILNRDFQHPADGWYQIEAKGEHPNHAAGVIQVIDDEAARSIVNRFNADAQGGALRQGSEMLIDHEHFSDQPDQETRAYGWLQELQNRDDGIYGRIRWTATGKPAVDGGDYRFFSTEYSAKDLKVLNDGKPKRIRPLRLDGLTLTNMNNNRGQKPITNRSPMAAPANGMCPECDVKLKKTANGMSCPECGKNFADADASADTNETVKNKMKNLLTAMGLSAEASEENALVEWSKIKNRLDAAAPLVEENKQLKADNEILLGEQVDALLDAYGVKEEKLRNRMKLAITTLKNREERITALAEFGFKPVEPAKAGANARVLNRSEGREVKGATATTDERELAQKAESEITDFKIRNRCTYAEARNAVRHAKPELFGLTK